MSKQIHREGNRRKQVKIHADEEIVDNFDEGSEYDNRSEALRSLMVEASSQSAETHQTPLSPPDHDDLATAYRRLASVANRDGVVRRGTAQTVLTSVLNITKSEVGPMFLKPLTKRGSLQMQGNTYGDVSYKLAGWST